MVLPNPTTVHTLKCRIDLKRKKNSASTAPTFIIPKKNGTICFIFKFREINERIKRKLYPIPKIQDLLLKLEGFKYDSYLDLSTGYYHIKLCPFSRKLCTIVLPWMHIKNSNWDYVIA